MTVAVEVEDEAWQAVPELEMIAHRAVDAALAASNIDPAEHELAILFTNDDSIAEINAAWRGKTGPTNVLSFPAPEDLPVPEGEARPLGDVVLAFGVMTREAAQQDKALPDHVAHLIIHGVLHLLGHDHEDDAEAQEMERLEAEILKGLGISNPYE